MPKQKEAPKAVTQDDINEFEVIVFRVVQPRNNRFFPNGYLKVRVRPGEETEIPRWHPLRDRDGETQLVDGEGRLLYRENKVPKGCEFIAFEDRTPRRRAEVKPDAGKTSKTKPAMRAADMPVGA